MDTSTTLQELMMKERRVAHWEAFGRVPSMDELQFSAYSNAEVGA